MIDTVCIQGDLANVSTKSQSNYFLRLEQFQRSKAPRSRQYLLRGGSPYAKLGFRIIVFNEVVSL